MDAAQPLVDTQATVDGSTTWRLTSADLRHQFGGSEEIKCIFWEGSSFGCRAWPVRVVGMCRQRTAGASWSQLSAQWFVYGAPAPIAQ